MYERSYCDDRYKTYLYTIIKLYIMDRLTARSGGRDGSCNQGIRTNHKMAPKYINMENIIKQNSKFKITQDVPFGRIVNRLYSKIENVLQKLVLLRLFFCLF